MRNFIMIFLALIIYINSFGQRACDFTIPISAFAYDAKAVKPGQTICFASGIRKNIEISNIIGTLDNPIYLTNEPTGKVLVQSSGAKNSGGFYTMPFSINIYNSSFFRFTGANNPNEKYGIEVTKTHMGPDVRRLSTDFEIDHIHVYGVSSVGVVGKTDASCDKSTWRGNFTMKNIKIHDNLIEDSMDEGFYIGNSHYSTGVTLTCGGISTKIFEHDVINVEVNNNIVLNSGRDGIQVGSVILGMNVHDNKVTNFATRSLFGHQSGIQINQGSTGNIYLNEIKKGTGYGIFIEGSGGSNVYENLVINSDQGAILISDFVPIKTTPFLITNNTLIDNKDNIVYVNTQNTLGNYFANNIVVSKRETNKFPTYVDFRINNPTKTSWKQEANVFTDDILSLKLDSAYVPMKGSVVDKLNVGWKQRKIITENGTIIVIDDEIFVDTPTKRYKL